MLFGIVETHANSNTTSLPPKFVIQARRENGRFISNEDLQVLSDRFQRLFEDAARLVHLFLAYRQRWDEPKHVKY
jgi:hypothetical protein